MTSVWADVDWSKSTGAIATERGVAISTVSKARRRYAPETLGAYSARTKDAPVDDLQKRLKAATARADSLVRERDQLRKKLAVARRAFETAHALLRPVLEERDAALARLGTTPEPAPPAPPPPPPPPRPLPTPAGLTTWQPVTGPDAPPLPPTKPRPRGPRAPATDRALATALERHPDLAEGFTGGTLTDAWSNPGAASGVDAATNHP